MRERLSPRQAASRLQVSLGQLHELVEADWLAEPDERGTLAVDSVEALEKLLVALEVGLLGLDLLDRPPAYLTPAQAATWLGVDEDALVELADRGVLEAISFEELGDLEVVELLRAVEAAAPEADWTDGDASWVDLVSWKVRVVGYGLRQRDRDEAQAYVGADLLYRTDELRKLARGRGRFNPPRRRGRRRRRRSG